ncbi:MAG: hypothetical protein O7D91_17520 [Planctomycetota bacterium]|nr:hypothetical protein [Planctomycetota bacterium]
MSILKVNTGTRSAPVYEEVSGGSGNVVGPASSTDNAIARYDGVTGKQIQDSKTTISDAGAMTVDDGSSNAIVLTPDSTGPAVAMNGNTILSLVPVVRIMTLSSVAGTGSAINLLPQDAAGVATIGLRNASTGQATKVDVGSDVSGGTGSINADNLTARRTNGDLTLAGNGSGDVVVDGRKVSDIIQRQASFSFVNPVTGQDFLLDGVPVGATITECYAIVNGGTSAVFSVVMRARSAPFSSGTNIVSAQTATTTGGTKTLASTTYTADNVLRITTGTVTGSVTELLILLVYTVD